MSVLNNNIRELTVASGYSEADNEAGGTAIH
jgi:hypothetical protein